MDQAPLDPPPADRVAGDAPGGAGLRADRVLRWALAASLCALALGDPAVEHRGLWVSAGGISAVTQLLAGVPRVAPLASLALAVVAGIASGPPAPLAVVPLAFAVGALSLARLALFFGGRGAQLLRVDALALRRRRALIATGLCVRRDAVRAGDLYEEAGRARRAIAALGGKPGRTEGWRVVAKALAWGLGGVPGDPLEAWTRRAERQLRRGGTALKH